jgi:hypothetical protein
MEMANLKEYFLKKEKDLVDVKIIKYPGNENLYIANLIYEEGWFETLMLVSFENQKVKWYKLFDEPGTAIMDVKSVRIKGFKTPLVQVYDFNHQKHGCFYLYEITNGKPNLLMEAFAVDNSWDEIEYKNIKLSYVIRGKKLNVNYKDINNDGNIDVVLNGFIDFYTGEPDKKHNLVGTGFWKKVFLYDKKLKRFKIDNRSCEYSSKFKYTPYYLDYEKYSSFN